LTTFHKSIPNLVCLLRLLDLVKICDYALKHYPVIVNKRLGYILQHIGLEEGAFDKLLKLPIKTYQKFDPTGPRTGKYNKQWMLIENI